MEKLQLKQLVELAFQYGPFLFALLFTIYVSRWTYGNWNRAIVRKEPSATPEEKATLQWTFICTAVFGAVLVAFSVAWWAKYRSEEHTSELQSQSNLVCRLLLEKKNT